MQIEAATPYSEIDHNHTPAAPQLFLAHTADQQLFRAWNPIPADLQLFRAPTADQRLFLGKTAMLQTSR